MEGSIGWWEGLLVLSMTMGPIALSMPFSIAQFIQRFRGDSGGASSVE